MGEWSAARPGRKLHAGKTRYPFHRRLGGPQDQSGRPENFVPHRDSIPDRPARSSVVIPTELLRPLTTIIRYINKPVTIVSITRGHIRIQVRSNLFIGLRSVSFCPAAYTMCSVQDSTLNLCVDVMEIYFGLKNSV